jgi:hypothetical protein
MSGSRDPSKCVVLRCNSPGLRQSGSNRPCRALRVAPHVEDDCARVPELLEHFIDHGNGRSVNSCNELQRSLTIHEVVRVSHDRADGRSRDGMPSRQFGARSLAPTSGGAPISNSRCACNPVVANAGGDADGWLGGSFRERCPHSETLPPASKYCTLLLTCPPKHLARSGVLL